MSSAPVPQYMRRFVALNLLMATAAPHALMAQEKADQATENTSSTDLVVVGERIKGAVDTKIKPIEEISEKDIAGLGATSVAGVLAAVTPQAGSGRGRGGGGMPIILLNGQRISGFRELRDLPSEAIKRVQIFPEELAIKYGFRPDQRVINFILKDNFASFNAEIEHTVPEQGGFSTSQWSTGFTRIGATERFNIATDFQHSDRLLESRRNIISASSALPFTLANGDTNISQYRSLRPATEQFDINGTYSKAFDPLTLLSLNVNYKKTDSSSLLGLPAASILVPANSPFAQSPADVTLNRYFTQPRALTRKSTNDSINLGSSFNTVFGDWRITLSGDYSNDKNRTRTDRNNDFTELQAGVLAGTINPYASNFGDNLLLGQRDLSESLNQNLNLLGTVTGKIFRLPAGDVQTTLRGGFNRQSLDSESLRRGQLSLTNLRRSNRNYAISIDIPILARSPIGGVSVNANIGQSDLSDFGRLVEYGAGVQWKPTKALSLSASIISDENAPSIGNLGNPFVVTPNVAVYDFQRGQTVFIDQINGGNPALLGESRKDLKLALNWSPPMVEGLNLQVEYFRNKSTNTTAGFPLLTPEIEAAFPGRVVRDTTGQLRSIDRRPINYAQERAQRIRYGINFSGSIGPSGRGMFGGGGGGSGGGFGRPSGGGASPATATGTATPTIPNTTPSAAPSTTPPNSPAPPASGKPTGRGGAGVSGGGGGFGAGMMGGGRQPSRWQISLYDTWTLQDSALIRDGLDPLDRLNGTAVDDNGGTPRHAVELAGGIFHKGLGMRLSGNYRSATRITGNAALGSGDLRFSDLATINTNFFVDLDSRGSLTKKIPLLKGGRVAFRIENILNDIIDVRDANGRVPISYQPGYLDPRGRVFELSFRKRF
jgi:iron complex outermembrane recepter protein